MLSIVDVRVSLTNFNLRLRARLAAGERVAVLGASGSGKSTLLSLLAGFYWPDTGRILYNEADISRLPVAERPMSIVFQDGNLFPHLSVFDNVALGVRPELTLTGQDRMQVDRALKQVGLSGMGARRPRALSGGQRSRVALARMLLRDKPISLLDEPFAALDPGLRAEMLVLLGDLCAARSLSLVLATHDLRDAERICNRLWFLDAGQVVFDAPIAGLRANPPAMLRPWL